MSLSQETDPVQVVTEFGQSVLPKAVAARSFQMPSRLAAPQEFAQAVITCRAQLDVLEELLGQAQAVSGEVRRTAAELEAAARESWDNAVTSRKGQDYETGKEREAHANLQTLPQRRQANQWAKAADLAKDLAERIRLMHRGLDSTRLDIHRVLGYFPVERSMERGA